MDEDDDKILGLVFELDEDDVERVDAVVLTHPDGTYAVVPEKVLRAFAATPEGVDAVRTLISDGNPSDWSAEAQAEVDWVPPFNLPELGGHPEPPACTNTGILLRPGIPTSGWPINPDMNLPVPIIIPPRPWPPPGPHEPGVRHRTD